MPPEPTGAGRQRAARRLGPLLGAALLLTACGRGSTAISERRPSAEPTTATASASASPSSPSLAASAASTPEPLATPPWQDPALPPLPEAAEPPVEPIDVAFATTAPAQPPALVSAEGFSWPLLGSLTSLFGAAHPLGIDLAATLGQAVLAAADGRVVATGVNDGYGYYAVIDHPGGYTTLYSHFVRPAEVAVGSVVRRGDLVGFAGSTGNSTGPHLHFEVRLQGSPIDPLSVLPATPGLPALVAALSPAELAKATPPTPTPTTLPDEDAATATPSAEEGGEANSESLAASPPASATPNEPTLVVAAPTATASALPASAIPTAAPATTTATPSLARTLSPTAAVAIGIATATATGTPPLPRATPGPVAATATPSVAAILAPSASATPTATATPARPLLAKLAAPPARVGVGQPVRFDASASEGAIVRYSWSFGDGRFQLGEAIVTHSFAAAGVYEVTVDVVGADGQDSVISVWVTVTDPAGG